MQVAFDWQAETASQLADFVEREDPPFWKLADDETIADFAFRIILRNVPREVAVWCEPFDVECGIRIFGSGSECRDVGDDVGRQKIVGR